MIPSEEYIELLQLDFEALEKMLRDKSSHMNNLRDRHFKALKKILLMELLLTMDLPRDRIVLTPENKLWLLRNVQINNGTHPDLERVVRLLKEFVQDDDASRNE